MTLPTPRPALVIVHMIPFYLERDVASLINARETIYWYKSFGSKIIFLEPDDPMFGDTTHPLLMQAAEGGDTHVVHNGKDNGAPEINHLLFDVVEAMVIGCNRDYCVRSTAEGIRALRPRILVYVGLSACWNKPDQEFYYLTPMTNADRRDRRWGIQVDDKPAFEIAGFPTAIVAAQEGVRTFLMDNPKHARGILDLVTFTVKVTDLTVKSAGTETFKLAPDMMLNFKWRIE